MKKLYLIGILSGLISTALVANSILSNHMRDSAKSANESSLLPAAKDAITELILKDPPTTPKTPLEFLRKLKSKFATISSLMVESRT